MAEIKAVRAWPMPIHQTKLMIGNAQPIGIFVPQMPMFLQEQIRRPPPPDVHQQEAHEREGEPRDGRVLGEDDPRGACEVKAIVRVGPGMTAAGIPEVVALEDISVTAKW